MKLIINADDFGYSLGHNYGIVRAHTHGVLTSTTLMANGTEVNHAISLAKENPTLDVGIHVVLDFKKPLSQSQLISSLVDEDGAFKKLSYEDINHLSTQEVALEIEAQIKFLLDQGIELTHMDSHHHIHMHPHLFPQFVALAKKYDLILRLVKGFEPIHQQIIDEHHIKTVICNPSFYQDEVSLNFFENYSSKYDVEELMTHPAYCDEVIINESSYTMKRVVELQVLTHHRLKTILKEQNIELSSFKQIKENV